MILDITIEDDRSYCGSQINVGHEMKTYSAKRIYDKRTGKPLFGKETHHLINSEAKKIASDKVLADMAKFSTQYNRQPVFPEYILIQARENVIGLRVMEIEYKSNKYSYEKAETFADMDCKKCFNKLNMPLDQLKILNSQGKINERLL